MGPGRRPGHSRSRGGDTVCGRRRQGQRRPRRGSPQECHEPRTKDVLANSLAYMHPSFGGEAILSIGKAADYVKLGLAGIVNVMPFTCMPGMVVTAISKRFREDYDHVPWLNLAYDGQEESQSLTRLEAFMHQVKEFHKRTKR